MNSLSAGMRLPAEWEPSDAVLLAWPHELTDWAYMLPEARSCIASIVRAVSEEMCVMLIGPADLCLDSVRAQGFSSSRVKFFDIPTNDTWARDFGPITCVGPDGALSGLDFGFNAWGLKFAANLDNQATSRLFSAGAFASTRVNRLSFILEGGSVETDGCGTLLTTTQCLLSPNRNGSLSRQEIIDTLRRDFGVHTVHMLRHGALAGDDTDSHIDTLARMASTDAILYVGAGAPGGRDYQELAAMKEELALLRTPAGDPYHLVELPLPEPISDEDGLPLPATYANYLITPRRIYLPVYGQPLPDRLATMTLSVVFPRHEIVPVDCRALIRQHGSLHCVTMQLPAGSVAGIADGCWTQPNL